MALRDGYMTNNSNKIIKYTKEVDSMNSVAMKRTGYKKLDFQKVNFAEREEIGEDYMEDVTPIHWTNEVLSGEKTVVIKKQKRE